MTSDGHSATISEPYETDFNKAYIQFAPQQIWAYDNGTGAILQKWVAGPPKPLNLAIEVPGPVFVYVTLDDQSEAYLLLTSSTIFRADRQIAFRTTHRDEMNKFSFKVNGHPVKPEWHEGYVDDGRFSASAVFRL